MANPTVRSPVNPIQPGAYSVIDASALQSVIGSVIPIPMILGTAQGAQPNQPLYFRDAQALRNILRGGPAFDAARFAFAQFGGPVGVVRVGQPVRGTLSLAGATGNPILITAFDYGVWTNSIRVAVAANNIITVSYTDAFGVSYVETFNLGAGATVQAIADAINGKTLGIAGSQWVTATVQSGTAPLAVLASTPLTGGTDGSAPVAGDWTTALAAIEPEPVDLIVPATGDATVHAQVLTHCQAMSQPLARRERTAVVGGVLGETVGGQITRIASLRDKRIQLVYPGIVDFDVNGVLSTWDPFYAAALIAGMHAALPDEATALTHKLVDVPETEKHLSTITGGDVDQLLAAGVTPIAPAPINGFWIVDSLSGYNLDDNFRDFHKIRTADTVAIRARQRLENAFVGGKVLDSTVADITTEARSLCQDLVNEGLLRAFQEPVVQNGPTPRHFQVSLRVMLPDVAKFILITVALQPASTAVPSANAATNALI